MTRSTDKIDHLMNGKEDHNKIDHLMNGKEDHDNIKNENNNIIKVKNGDIVEHSHSEKFVTEPYEYRYIWHNIVGIVGLHLVTLCFMILCTVDWISRFVPVPVHFGSPKPLTYAWIGFLLVFGGLGVTMGAHRLWTHRAYKAKLPLRLLLIFCYSVAGHNRIYDWVRDHRVHHKYSETDADPHNANRGFFFSHVGWLFLSKHPRVLEKGKQIDMSDITSDKLIMFHQRFFYPFQLTFSLFFPLAIPMYFWNERFHIALLATAFRYAANLNGAWSVNSFAHISGFKPYDRRIGPTQNTITSFFALGEGWHNYHHVFPWDYKTSELGTKLNWSTFFINLFNKIGWAYDLKTASPELIKKIALKYGDGTFGDTEIEHKCD